jgi:nucleotide-binding universal stress UspA family protein
MATKILIPLDGSPLAEAAVAYVENLIVQLKPATPPEITLLQVVRVPGTPVSSAEPGTYLPVFRSQWQEGEKQRAVDYLEKAGEPLRRQGATVACVATIGESGESSATRIIEAEIELSVDLVVMSTHGRRGITRWAFGSVAEKVLRGGKVPVLMVGMKR